MAVCVHAPFHNQCERDRAAVNAPLRQICAGEPLFASVACTTSGSLTATHQRYQAVVDQVNSHAKLCHMS